jgi:hypothetical protein
MMEHGEYKVFKIRDFKVLLWKLQFIISVGIIYWLFTFIILATPDNHCLLKNFEGGPIEIRLIINNGILAVEYSLSEDSRYPSY